MKSIAPALALLLAAFGAGATQSATALERQDDELRTLRAATSRGQNPAVLALLETAERELGAGRPEQASALLERALRIEPRNPTVWHYLSLSRFELGHTTQAEAMAAKSRSLVAGEQAPRVFASRYATEPARSYADNRREQQVTEQRRWPPVEAAAQAWRDMRSFARREGDAADEDMDVRARAVAERTRREQAAERTRRERAARREEWIQQQAAAESERRNRNRRSNEVRRQRPL
jgi:hypothetical protein